MPRTRLNITGKTFGKLYITDRFIHVTYGKRKRLKNVCECSCGNEHLANTSDLIKGSVVNCGRCPEVFEKSMLSPVKCLFGNYMRAAEKRQLEFKLSFEQFYKLILQDCYYCKSKPSQFFHKKGARKGVKYNGIDRLDNNKGYIIDNCYSCCKFCNFAKSKGSISEFLEWIDRIKKNN